MTLRQLRDLAVVKGVDLPKQMSGTEVSPGRWAVYAREQQLVWQGAATGAKDARMKAIRPLINRVEG
jgi:hypothetical protein